MMRICIVSFFYKPVGGGIPRYVEDISKKLGELGHSVDIITASYNGKKIERQGKILTYYLPFMNIFNKKEQENIENSREFLNFFKRYASRRKPDVIFAQNMQASISSIGHSFALNMVAIEKKLPLVLSAHSFPENPGKDLKIALSKNLAWDKIIPVSSALAETLHAEGVPVEKMSIVNCGVDTNLFKPGLGKKWLRSRIGTSEKDIIILHASRIDALEIIEQKGIKTLLKAVSLLDQKTKIKLLFAVAPNSPAYEESKNENIEKINNLAKLLGIENKVKIMTFNPNDMPLVYNGADIFVMASQLETFGLVYAEALACGIPVIGTSVGGVPEVIEDTKSGYLIPPDDSVMLSKALKKLINSEERRKKFGDYGIKSIKKRFEIENITKKLVGIFNSVIKD